MTYMEVLHYMSEGYDPADQRWYTQLRVQARLVVLAWLMPECD